MGEKKPRMDASTKAEVRQRVLPDDHFEFRDDDVGNRVDAEHDFRPVLGWREARLRREFAHIYPCLVPDVWELAAIVVDKVLAWRLQQRRGLVGRDRVLDPRHFDLRGSFQAVTTTSLEQYRDRRRWMGAQDAALAGTQFRGETKDVAASYLA
jgi:hypothetical protein